MLGGRSSLFIVSEIVYFIIIFIFYTDMSNNFYCYMSNLTSFMLKELLVSFMWQEKGRNNQGQGWVGGIGRGED